MHICIYRFTQTYINALACLYLSICMGTCWVYGMTDYSRTVPRHSESHDTGYEPSQQLPGQTCKQVLLHNMSCLH